MAGPQYELLMPFLPVQSRGGPHDDAAYVAGFDMGQLNIALEHLDRRMGAVQMIHEENQAQADLIAMRHNRIASFQPAGEGWVQMTIPVIA